MFIKLLIIVIIMKKTFLFLVFILVGVFSGCSGSEVVSESGVEKVAFEKKKIVAVFFPVAEITSAVVGDFADVSILVGRGIEPHSFDVTPRQVEEISKSDVFVGMGEGVFESIEKKIENSGGDFKFVNVGLEMEEEEHSAEHHEEGEDEGEHMEEHSHEHHHHHEGEFDPHVWLSLHLMEEMTENVVAELSVLFPEKADEFRGNGDKYLEELEKLYLEFESGLESCEKDVIIVSHKAFGYLAEEFGFEQVSVAGFSPESEPSPSAIMDVVKVARENNLSFIFTEGQLDKKTSMVLAEEFGGEVLELNPILSDEMDYFELMRNNLKSLRVGLVCE